VNPDAAELLEAVAVFLKEDLQVEDRRLAYRVRVATYLVSMVARELRADLGEVDTEALVTRIQAGEVDEKLHGDLMALLREQLAVVQPHFDTALDVEKA